LTQLLPLSWSNFERATIPADQLFKTKSTGLAFKLKSLFRSKNSLADEMRRNLSGSESHLVAYVFQKSYHRPVPHSAFHSLESSHMRTIITHLNSDKWYRTFSQLDASEHDTLYFLLHPFFNGKYYERELVVLEILHHNRISAWMALLSGLLRNQPFPHAKGRIVLAICREKNIDGKTIPAQACGPPLQRPLKVGAPVPRIIRVPPLPRYTDRGPRISVCILS
jgi:hypothetical protein